MFKYTVNQLSYYTEKYLKKYIDTKTLYVYYVLQQLIQNIQTSNTYENASINGGAI